MTNEQQSNDPDALIPALPAKEISESNDDSNPFAAPASAGKVAKRVPIQSREAGGLKVVFVILLVIALVITIPIGIIFLFG